LAAFQSAQEAKKVHEFLPTVYTAFLNEWPVDSPTAKELTAAKGNEQLAITNKVKAVELVSKISNHPINTNN